MAEKDFDYITCWHWNANIKPMSTNIILRLEIAEVYNWNYAKNTCITGNCFPLVINRCKYSYLRRFITRGKQFTVMYSLLKFNDTLQLFHLDMKKTSGCAELIPLLILLHEKFLQFDWLRAVVFQLNLKYLHVKITNLAGSSINN